MADESAPADVMDAASAAIAGVQAAVKDLATDLAARIDGLALTQAQTLEHILKLQPVQAIETEAGGAVDALDPAEHDPPAAEPNEPEQAESALRKLHNVLG